MDEPIRGQTRELTHKINVPIEAKIHNRFDIEVVDSRTGKVRQRAQAENVICNQWYTDTVNTAVMPFSYIAYGSGSGTPSATDTGLFTFVSSGSASDSQYSIDRANRYASLRKKIQLSETTAVGKTITEVGILDENRALVTHAMLKDMNSNQISITKTDTDIINIYATVFAHWSASFYTGEIRFGTFENASSPSLFLQWLLGDASVFPSSYNTDRKSGSVAYSSWTRGNYTNKTITTIFQRLAASNGNQLYGIRILVIADSYGGKLLQIFTGGTTIKPTVVSAEAIGTGDGSTVDFATDFDCPTNATIYADGVEAAVVVDNVPLAYNDMGRYFDRVVVENGVAYPSIYTDQLADGLLHAPTTGTVYYNNYYSIGVGSIHSTRCKVEVSDDLLTWTQISSGYETVTVPEANRHAKYWRITSLNPQDVGWLDTIVGYGLTGKNIHFATAPATGAVITGNYTTPRLAKDTNHVFDLTLSITLADYTA